VAEAVAADLETVDLEATDPGLADGGMAAQERAAPAAVARVARVLGRRTAWENWATGICHRPRNRTQRRRRNVRGRADDPLGEACLFPATRTPGERAGRQLLPNYSKHLDYLTGLAKV
jgi:hypothetical protein